MYGRREAAPTVAGRTTAGYRAGVHESEDDLTARRFRLTLDLFGLAEAMMRQNLRRRHPQATEAEIEAEMLARRQRRPGAESGDCPGRLRSWPAGVNPIEAALRSENARRIQRRGVGGTAPEPAHGVLGGGGPPLGRDDRRDRPETRISVTPRRSAPPSR